MVRATKIFTWDCAHRLSCHTGKCRNLHGHLYRAEITVTTEGLNDLGMVMDFADMKKLMGTWIEDSWDHTTILFYKDPLLSSLAEHGLKLFACSEEPTAEWMAMFLKSKAQELMPCVEVTKVLFYETPTSYAEA